MGWLSALGFGKDRNQTEKGRYDKEVSERDTSESYQSQGDEHDICGYPTFSDRGEQIGNVNDYVVDGTGKLRYLVINAGFWAVDKKILVPVGMAQIESDRQQVILSGLTREQVEAMPAYDEQQDFSEDYETNLMQYYYPNQRPYVSDTGQLDYDRYHQFKTPERLQLLEERLQINKRQQMQGEVTIGKHVETRQETVEVPVNRERLVIERHPARETTVADAGNVADAQGRNLQDDTMTIPLYTEEVEVTKKPVVAEEVTIRKEQETETRTVRETVSREELDINDPQHLSTGAQNNIQGNKGRSDRGIEGTSRGPSSGSARQKKTDVKVDVIRTDDQS